MRYNILVYYTHLDNEQCRKRRLSGWCFREMHLAYNNSIIGEKTGVNNYGKA